MGFDSQAGITTDANTIDARAIDAGPSGPEQWQELGGSGSGEGVSETPTANSLHASIGISPSGVVHALYSSDVDGNSEVYLKAWDGAQWQGVGSSADPGGISNDAAESSPGSLAFGSDGRPQVAWMSFDGARSIHYRFHNGTSWLEQSSSATGRGVSENANPFWPSLAISAGGDVFIAYETYNVIPSGGAIHVKGENNGAWEGIAGSATGEGISDGVSDGKLVRMALEGDDMYAAWQETRPTGTDIYVAWFSPGLGWQALGTSLSAGGISQSANTSERPTIRVRDGSVYVSWSEVQGGVARAYMRKFTGGTWQELGGSGSGDGFAGDAAEQAHFVLDENSLPLAVWVHDDGVQQDVYAARWTGTTWQPAGSNGGNVSDTATASLYPTVDVDAAGNVYAAWLEYVDGGRSAIYVRSLTSGD